MWQEKLDRFEGGKTKYKDIVRFDVFENSNEKMLSENQLNENLIKMGYDGLTHMGGKIMGQKDHRVWIAFEPNQIKSTKAEKFDPNEDDMTKARTA
jgi:hypothetical protein